MAAKPVIYGSLGPGCLRPVMAAKPVILVRSCADRGGIAKSRDFGPRPVPSGLEKHQAELFSHMYIENSLLDILDARYLRPFFYLSGEG